MWHVEYNQSGKVTTAPKVPTKSKAATIKKMPTNYGQLGPKLDEEEQIRIYQKTIYGDDADLGDRPHYDWSDSGDDMDSSDYESYLHEPEDT